MIMPRRKMLLGRDGFGFLINDTNMVLVHHGSTGLVQSPLPTPSLASAPSPPRPPRPPLCERPRRDRRCSGHNCRLGGGCRGPGANQCIRCADTDGRDVDGREPGGGGDQRRPVRWETRATHQVPLLHHLPGTNLIERLRGAWLDRFRREGRFATLFRRLYGPGGDALCRALLDDRALHVTVPGYRVLQNDADTIITENTVPGAQALPTVVVFHDPYMRGSLWRMMAPHFRRAVFAHNRGGWQPALVDRERPAVVLHEVAARLLPL